MAKKNEDRVVRRLTLHQGTKFDQPTEAMSRQPILFEPSSDSGLNHERLPDQVELASMSLAYREQPISDEQLLESSDRLLSGMMLLAIAGVLTFVTILPCLSWYTLMVLASLGSLYAIVGQYRRSAFSIRNFLSALVLPLAAVALVKGFSVLLIRPTILAVVLAVVTLLVYGRFGRAPFEFYRDWLLTEPRLRPATRKKESLNVSSPSLLVLIGLLAAAVLLPWLSQWLAMVVVAAASVVWIAGNAVRLSWSATRQQVQRILQGMRETFAQYTMYGQWATRAPGVWYPEASCKRRRSIVVALCVLPLLTLSVAWSGFVPWDLPLVSGRFKTACIEKIAPDPVLFATLKKLTPRLAWAAYPGPYDESYEESLPNEAIDRVRGKARNQREYYTLIKEEFAEHARTSEKKRRAKHQKEMRDFYQKALSSSPHVPMLVAVLGLIAGDTFFLWIIAVTLVLAAVLPVLVIVAILTPAVRAAAISRETVDALDLDDRCEWQWYVDRVRSSPHNATEPLGAPVEEKNHLFLGVEPTADYPVLLDRNILSEHAYIVGDSGSGKTSLGLMPLLTQLIRGDTGGQDAADQGMANDENQLPPPPMVILDLKGDPALFHTMRQEAERRSPNNPDAFLYFTPEQGRESCFFNPFASLVTENRSTLQLCQILLDSLNLNHGEGYGRSYYSRQNRQMLFEALSREPQPRSMEELHARLQQMARQKDSSDVFELLATIEALTQYPQLATGEPNSPDDRVIQMQRALRESQVVYFWLPSALESASVREIGKLALYSLLTAAIDRQRDGEPVRQAYLVIDEFQRLASENFKIILEQARSFGIATILANQSRADLKLHDVDLRPTINTNTRFKQFFSVTDPRETKELSDLSGEELMTQTSTSISYGSSISETLSFEKVIKPRMMINDILGISDHPLDSLVHVSRGSGYTQFGGACIHLRSTWPMTKQEYDRRADEPWPSTSVDEGDDEVEPGGTVVSERTPAEIDRDAEIEAARLRDEAMRRAFEKYESPPPKRAP